jgi:hypothetical protein
MAPRVSEGVTGAIRPIACAVIRSRRRVLVWEDFNPATGEVVAVPLAGGVEFGETRRRRELMEEIGAAASGVRYLGLLEDIFEWNGQKRHELHLVYEVELADRRILDPRRGRRRRGRRSSTKPVNSMSVHPRLQELLSARRSRGRRRPLRVRPGRPPVPALRRRPRAAGALGGHVAQAARPWSHGGAGPRPRSPARRRPDRSLTRSPIASTTASGASNRTK